MIVRSSDFYSMSAMRDLLFHVTEHNFTLTQIQSCLDDLELKFCGFENAKLVNDFKLTHHNKNDIYKLEKWEIYEKENPNAFSRMYQFWCQNPLKDQRNQ